MTKCRLVNCKQSGVYLVSSVLASFQIRHQPTRKVGCQPGHRKWILNLQGFVWT